MVPFNPYAISGPEIWIMIWTELFEKTGIVRAKRIPKSNEFCIELRTTDGSTYAIGNLIPDAFSILAIPSKTRENLLLIKSNSLFGSWLALNAS